MVGGHSMGIRLWDIVVEERNGQAFSVLSLNGAGDLSV